MTTLNLKIDVREVEGLAERIGQVTGGQLGQAALRTVNEVATRFDESAYEGIIARYNLDPAYIRPKIALIRAATPRNPRAEIVARGDLTIIGRYGPSTVIQPGAARRAGPVAGRRSAGVQVEVRRGQPQLEPQWFLMRLRSGAQAGDRVGAFVRTSARGGRPKHLYGPSPYSMLRQQGEYRSDEVLDDLTRTALVNLVDAVEAAL